MNVLAIGAHPDDLEFMCAGTLLKCKNRGDKIFVALTTSGNTGSNVIPTKEETAAVREAEQLACCEYYGAQTMFLRFDDEGLLDTPETRRAVLTAIRWANPDVIFTHNPRDFSTDHNMTARLVTEVLLSVGGNLHPADLPPIDKKPHVFFEGKKCFVNIGEQMETSLEMLRCHKSQIAWMETFLDGEDFTEQYIATAKMYGTWSGCTYAEGFEAHKILGYCADYRLLP